MEILSLLLEPHPPFFAGIGELVNFANARMSFGQGFD